MVRHYETSGVCLAGHIDAGLCFVLAFNLLVPLFPSMTLERFLFAVITATNLPVERLVRYWKRWTLKPEAYPRGLISVCIFLMLYVLAATIVLVTAIGLLEHWFPWAWSTLLPLALISALLSVISSVLRLQLAAKRP